MSPIKTVAPRKGNLITLAFNCSSQQSNDITIVKYAPVPAQVAGLGSNADQTTFVAGL